MYYKTTVSANKLEKQMHDRNFKLWQKNVLGLEAYVVGDEVLNAGSTGFLTREDHIIFFANLIELAARTENWTPEKFLAEVQKIIEYRTQKNSARR